MKKNIYLFPIAVLIFSFIITCKKETNPEIVTDVQGNVYKTITIGTQVWMAENLRTTAYNNGDPIPEETDQAAWDNLTTGAYCNYNNTRDPRLIVKYGRLYNWHTISNNSNIAPAGWHVPTDEDWTTLITYLGGTAIAGGKVKESGTLNWNSPNAGASNTTGFTALPGGRIAGGQFTGIGHFGQWYTSTEKNATSAGFITISKDNSAIVLDEFIKEGGMSIRCVRDELSAPNCPHCSNSLNRVLFSYPITFMHLNMHF